MERIICILLVLYCICDYIKAVFRKVWWIKLFLNVWVLACLHVIDSGWLWYGLLIDFVWFLYVFSLVCIEFSFEITLIPVSFNRFIVLIERHRMPSLIILLSFLQIQLIYQQTLLTSWHLPIFHWLHLIESNLFVRINKLLFV